MNLKTIEKVIQEQLISLGKERDKIRDLVTNIESMHDDVDSAYVELEICLEALNRAGDTLSKDV